MCRSTEGRGLKPCHSAKTEVMSLPRNKIHIAPSFLRILIEYTSVLMGCRSAGAGKPENARNKSFEKIREPEKLRPGIAHREHRCSKWHSGSLCNRLNLD